MSIATELTLLANSKQAIKNSINAKGGSITDSTPFADYSTAIDNLPSGGGDDSTLIDLIERDITSITIPSGTTSIGDSTFSNCSNMTSVTIPNSVTSIAANAFYSSGITSINIPNSVTSLGNQAFSTCRYLTSATIGTGVQQLPFNLFSYCNRLENVSIPESVTSFANSVLNNCAALRSVIVPSGVTTMGNQVFQNCNVLTSLVFKPTTPPTIGSNAFTNTNNCPIYVPAASVDAYKAANNWSTWASRIYPIQQVATVDGNPVYNYEIGDTDATTITDVELEKMPAGTSVEFAEGITNIAAGEINYQQVTLPSTFTGFGDSDMIGSSVTTITSNAVTPPSAFKNRIGGSGLTAVYVPASAVDTYKENATWSSFASIIQAIPTE